MTLKQLVIFIGIIATSSLAFESFLNYDDRKSVFVPITRTDELLQYDPMDEDFELSDLGNYGNIGHFMTSIFLIGTPMEFRNESFFLPSTMWNDFVVNSIECEQCLEWDNHTYDRTNSTSSRFDIDTTRTVNLGLDEVEGFIGTDRVCWRNDSDYCVEEGGRLEAINYTSFYTPPITHNFAGFLGLAPLQTDLGWADAPSLVDRMFEERWIDRR